MFEDLTDAPCLGDTFRVDFGKQKHVVLLWSGQPCPDWSSSHLGRNPPGAKGATGWQYVAQAKKVLEVMPHAYVLEMVPNALRVDGGKSVAALLQSLAEMYTQFM